MNDKERKSCIGTIELLRRLAYNIHGVMDVIDAENCDKIISVLKQEPQTEWIPVKEDLPKTADSVLISINGKIGEINHEHSIMFGSYCSVDGWMIEDVKVDYNKDYFEVEAWRKAPEIYDGREGEE